MNLNQSTGSVADGNGLAKTDSILIKVSSTGLNDKNKTELESLINLTPDLQQNFLLLPESQAPQAAVVLVVDRNLSVRKHLRIMLKEICDGKIINCHFAESLANPQITPTYYLSSQTLADRPEQLTLY